MSEAAKILVVEDDSTVCHLWERFLRRWGHEPLLAADGAQGLRIARTTPLHLVITDLNMPVMSGQELLERLKAERPHLDVIVVTGEGSIELAVDMMKSGALDFLTKPINFSQAQLVVDKAIERYRSKEESTRLRRINRDLEALNEMKEKFIAITNHELRTPVNIINNVAQLMAAEAAGGPTEELVGLLRNSALHLREIVEQMHDVSQVNAARMRLVPTRFGLREAWEEVSAELALVLQKRRHRLACEIPQIPRWKRRRRRKPRWFW